MLRKKMLLILFDISFMLFVFSNSRIRPKDCTVPTSMDSTISIVYPELFFLWAIPKSLLEPFYPFHMFKAILSHLTHGAEPFLRSRHLCSYSRTSQHFMEPEGLLSCSQEPSIGPYPEPDQSNSCHPIQAILSVSYCSCIHWEQS
jgi:hypothetical protein